MTPRHRPDPAVPDPHDPLTAGVDELETFGLYRPTIAHTVPGFGSLRTPSPSRRVASVPPRPRVLAEHRAVRARFDWPALIGRVLLAVGACGSIGSMAWLWFANGPFELLLAGTVLGTSWIFIAAVAGWAFSRG